MAAYRRIYDSRHLQADCQNQDQLRNPTLGNRVWALHLLLILPDPQWQKGSIPSRTLRRPAPCFLTPNSLVGPPPLDLLARCLQSVLCGCCSSTILRASMRPPRATFKTATRRWGGQSRAIRTGWSRTASRYDSGWKNTGLAAVPLRRRDFNYFTYSSALLCLPVSSDVPAFLFI